MEDKFKELIIEKVGYEGMLLSMSKSGYRRSNPDNVVFFNANLCTENEKIWWGDLDLTKSKEKLLELAREMKETLFVLAEMDARFETEAHPKINRYIASFSPEGYIRVNPGYENYITDNLTIKPQV